MATPEDAAQRPNVPKGKHPVESTRYILPTPEAEELCEYACRIVQLRSPGGLFYGPPRYGKSRALEILRRELGRRFPGAPVVLLVAWDYTTPHERTFLSDLLVAAGHALGKSGTAGQLRDRLVSFLGAQGTQDGDGRVVVIIDEAQNLHSRHYNWLMGIHNLLTLLQVNLTVLLVGQPELLAQRAAFVRSDKQQIVGRFMTHVREFCGVRSAADLRAILSLYDEAIEFPAKSGWSFTRYYAADEFARGWRLAHLGEEFWAGFRSLCPLSKKDRRRDIPMQYVCRAAENFLTSIQDTKMTDEVARQRLVTEAILASGYRETNTEL